MLLAPQHRRSARIEARMQKTVQEEFNERVANGTMTKEELLNAPTCLRSFDEAEDAILAQDNTSWCGKLQNDDSEDDEFDNESTESMGSNPEGPVGGEFLWSCDKDSARQQLQEEEEEDEATRKAILFLNGRTLTVQDPVLLKLIVSKLPPLTVARIIKEIIQELDDVVEREIDEANMAVVEDKEEEEDSIASRLLARRLKASRGW
jgi:hypothetical protein